MPVGSTPFNGKFVVATKNGTLNYLKKASYRKREPGEDTNFGKEPDDRKEPLIWKDGI